MKVELKKTIIYFTAMGTEFCARVQRNKDKSIVDKEWEMAIFRSKDKAVVDCYYSDICDPKFIIDGINHYINNPKGIYSHIILG